MRSLCGSALTRAADWTTVTGVELVQAWPTYLLKRIPEELRNRLSEEAEQQNVSVQDVVRSALCERYGLDCELVEMRYQPQKDRRSQTLLLRLHPKLFKAIGRQAFRDTAPMRDVILDVLLDHYGIVEE